MQTAVLSLALLQVAKAARQGMRQSKNRRTTTETETNERRQKRAFKGRLHTAVLSVALLEVAKVLHELLYGDGLLVRQEEPLSRETRVVDENVGVGRDARHTARCVAVRGSRRKGIASVMYSVSRIDNESGR